MSNNQLRIEQYDTVLYNSNLNPMGVPESVKQALKDCVNTVIRYPENYYPALKTSISKYAGCKEDQLILSSGSSDLLRLFISILAPKKAMVLVPSFSEYEKVLNIFGCEIVYYELDEANNFQFDIADFVGHLDSSIDLIILGNPNNPTSQIISRDDMETMAEVCKELDTFLLIDEMYIEFVNKYQEITSTPLVDSYDNIAVLRSTSKFFAVPGLRLAYAVISNKEYLDAIHTTAAPNPISSITAAVCTEMLKDKKYIKESSSQIFTERNLIVSAMSTNKNVKLYKPSANFMLVQILKDGVTAGQIADHCKLKGIVIRNCENIRGLSDKFIRFCFMKPSQNDLLVNTILELLKD
ncbi:MAG: aminotransferase class I/II-fold pyridoxal phosphate-dependent enzyme [Lachnospiraceae bacterium]|nr:aminotransferase class I/II-fold pyridoxal phosphate-dependent enzyme [Lachnospiraceae bacterium]